MGILNLTPDSFYASSRHSNNEGLIEQTGKMIAAGADILDIGGYSSRPGATDVNESEEIDRVIPAITSIHQKYPEALISIDTFRSKVAEQAISAGASMINDISGGQQDERIFEVAAKAGVPYILMHMRGNPQNMNENTQYDNLTLDINRYFSQRISIAKSKGVKDIIIDPGFGFSKTIDQNHLLLQELDQLHLLGKPILVGISRKSMITKKLGISAAESLNGTTALNTIAIMKGASILRVHDVAEAKQVIDLLKP